MKKYLLFLILLPFLGFAQQTPEFSFELYFEDAAGNRDTVTIGYDANATDGIDPEFGEINTIDEDWSSDEFQVRITNGWESYQFNDNNESFRTKKQILKDKCDLSWTYNPYIYIDFKNVTFPIAINYDFDTFLENECIKWSVIGTFEQNALWDIGGYHSNMYFVTTEIILDTVGGSSNMYLETTNKDNIYCHYPDIDGKTIYSVWLRFSNSKITSTVNIDTPYHDNKMIAYPNPFNESFELEEITNMENIKIYDLWGKEIQYEVIGNKIFPLTNERGIYFLSFQVNGEWYNRKIMKQ